MAYVAAGGSHLYSEVAGTGEPVLVLHGGFGSLESLRPQLRALSQHRRVLAYERPGHGRSPDVSTEYSYTADVVTALDYLALHGIGGVDVVGYSDGAVIALLLAMAHPTRVRSLVAIGANLDPSAFAPADERDRALLMLDDATLEAEPSTEGERATYGRLSPDGAQHADVVLAKLSRLWATQPDISPADLARITAPTLVLAGDHDSVPVAHSLLIAASIRHAQLGIVPGTTHGLPEERPELVNLLLLEFLDSRGR